MPRNILILNSSQEKNQLLLNLLEELSVKNFSFHLLSPNLNLIKFFREKNWPAKKLWLGPILRNNTKSFSFIIFLLFLHIKIFIILLYYKYKKNISQILCLSWNEKIIVTPVAKILKLRVIWLERPDVNYQLLKKPLVWLYRLNSNFADLIAINNYTKIQLKNLGLNEEKIKIIQPGIKLSSYQDNIFNKLAQANRQNFHHKYFTVGTITNLDQKQKIEAIFQAVKICLSVIPNIQLIIIGDGQERKNLTWLADKMEIDNLVWFVGEQKQLKKWLDSFDIFVVINDLLNLDDYGNILEAMAAGLPIIGPRNIGLEDIIFENKTGSLIESENSEMLARQIIKLHQDKRLRINLGENGKNRATKFFSINNMVDQFTKIIG